MRQYVCIAGLILVTAPGCAGSLDDEELAYLTAAGDCQARVPEIFATSCMAGCHDSTAAADLDLESGDVAMRLRQQPASYCDGVLLDPASPETSVLYTKLTAEPPCGAPMPLSRTPLGQADLDCVLEWIAAQ